MKKKIGLLFSVVVMGTLLSACGNKSVGTDTLSFEDTYALFVENMMQDKISQLEVVADREKIETDSTIVIGMDNEMGQATIDINTTALVDEGLTSGLNLFDVDVVSDLLQLDGLVSVSHFSDIASTYYRLNQLDIEVGGLLAGNLGYIDVMKEQLQGLMDQWYILDSEMLLGEAAGASQLTDSLTSLPTDVYQGLHDHVIFDVEEKTADSYKVVLSEEGFSGFLDQMSTNQYVAQVFDLPTTGGAAASENLAADIQKINESVDMTLKIIDSEHVDLIVMYDSGSMTTFAMTLGYQGLTLKAGDATSNTVADISWLQESEGSYAIDALVAQSGATIIRVDGSHDIGFSDDNMSTVMDLNFYVSNALINLPIEGEEVLMTVKIDSETTHVENDIELAAPTDAKKFDDFLGGMAGEYVGETE